jgi:hypothetical protein
MLSTYSFPSFVQLVLEVLIQNVDSRKYNIRNSVRLITDLQTVETTEDMRMCSFDIESMFTTIVNVIKTPGLQSASELYRPSDRCLSAKLVPTLADRGVAWSAQRIPTVVNFGFLDRSPYFPFK